MDLIIKMAELESKLRCICLFIKNQTRFNISKKQKLDQQFFKIPIINLDPYELKESNSSLALKAENIKYSIIILNLNGADHLNSFFSSLLEFEDSSHFEVLLVDHNSGDNSIEVAESFFDRLPIRLFKCRNNNSFSYSNNFAAQKARSKRLVFVNNDIIWDESVLGTMADELENPGIGIVGIPLYYPDEKKQRSSLLQHGGIRFKMDDYSFFKRPVNLQKELISNNNYIMPAVTGAFMMCYKCDFQKVGGFENGYLYGYEDVDFCLSVRDKLNKKSLIVASVAAVHDESATQNKDSDEYVIARRRNNISNLKIRYGKLLDHYYKQDKLLNKKYWTSETYSVGLVVTDDSPDTNAGDYFTAMELGNALRKEFNWCIKYLSQFGKKKDYYNVEGLDCLVVLLDSYDLRKIKNGKKDLVIIAWMRNWFQEWLKKCWFQRFDLLLCSSQKAADFISNQTGRSCEVLPIATNPDRFSPKIQSDKSKQSDYCFTGNYWNSKREIEEFDPHELPYDFAIYGSGWKKHKQFKQAYRGFLKYQDMPTVYASTKLLIDDANHVTKPWGSVNSRVFDAIAAGKLAITNGDIGAQELFGNLLPCYKSTEELKEKIKFYLDNNKKREELANQLRSEILQKHTYVHRSHQLLQVLEKYYRNNFRIAIKIGVPNKKEAPKWGDYHFGLALKKELEALGHKARLDILPDWYNEHSDYDEVVIVLRGLSEYNPNPKQVNIMWQISHPDKTTNAEYEKYDLCLFASLTYVNDIKRQVSVLCLPLLQCTDPTRFFPSDTDKSDGRILFIGNSRQQYRKIVRDAINAGLNLHVYGNMWKGFIPRSTIKGKYIRNRNLQKYYAHCDILLNDHWKSMRENGFISNRLFDAAATGAVVVSDHVESLDRVFNEVIYTYKGGANELKRVVENASIEREATWEQRKKVAEKVRKEHSFKSRAFFINKQIKHIAGIKNNFKVGVFDSNFYKN